MCYPLCVVATPIGNLEDLSTRVCRVLHEADIILCEDTRHSGQMLKGIGCRARLVAYHKHNESARIPRIVQAMRDGKRVALICDAGTPGISDPGQMLVAAVRDAGLQVAPICGPSAVAAALSVCGFSGDAFTFLGFLPKGAAAGQLLKNCDGIVVFFESPKRILRTMHLLQSEFAQVACCVCNDLSKKFERIYTGSPAQILDEMCHASVQKGEYTCVIHLPPKKHEIAAAVSIPAMLADTAQQHGCNMRDAAKILRTRGIKKSAIFAAMLWLKNFASGGTDD